MSKKVTFRKRLHRISLWIQYNFDNLMAKGVLVNILLIFGITIFTVLVLTGLSQILTHCLGLTAETQRPFWTILIHIIDGGTVGNNQSKNVVYLTFMVVVTFLGLLMNGALIGTINAAVSKKINSLGLSNTKVYEQGHTVIIGFNSLTFTIIKELLAGMNPKKSHCIVVLSDLSLSEMNEQIRAQFPNTGRIKIVCRSGKPNDDKFLRLCSVSRASSVIINSENDFETIKLILGIRKYFEHSREDNPDLHISAIINEEENVETATVAGGNLVNIMYFKDAISRMIAHACRYPGFSKVLRELFSFEGSEIYFEEFPKLAGKRYRELLYMFNNSAVIGIEKNKSGKKILLNPDFDTLYEKGDRLIHIEKNSGTSKPDLKQLVKYPEEIENNNSKKDDTPELRNLLILGENELLFQVLCEFDKYINPDSTVTVVSKRSQKTNKSLPDFRNIKEYKNQSIESYTFANLKDVITEDYDTILLLNDLNVEEEVADSEIITCLLFIQNLMKTKNYKYNIISQLRTSLNQKIADMGFSDFVVGSEITSMISAQISENKYLQDVFTEILSSEGSELFIRPVTDYLKAGSNVSLHEVQKIAEKSQHIVIGCKKYNETAGIYEIELNPVRNKKAVFTEKDSFIILARERIV